VKLLLYFSVMRCCTNFDTACVMLVWVYCNSSSQIYYSKFQVISVLFIPLRIW